MSHSGIVGKPSPRGQTPALFQRIGGGRSKNSRPVRGKPAGKQTRQHTRGQDSTLYSLFHSALKMEQPNGEHTEQLSQSQPQPQPQSQSQSQLHSLSPDKDQNLMEGAQASNREVGSETHKAVTATQKSVRWSSELVTEYPSPKMSSSDGSNPYVDRSSVTSNSPQFNFKNTMDTVRDVLGRWGRKVGEASKKAEDLAGNTWQHLKTSPSFADAAMGRIAQGTKVLAEGGYEKIFRHTFETVPEEQLQNSYACYLSTSAGPVMGILYVSTAKLAFCSDNPLSYKAGDQMEWSYYKVVIPLHQLKAINPSLSRSNPAEKYIQVISVDNHEFWYMGFLNYNGAVKCLQDALQTHSIQSV